MENVRGRFGCHVGIDKSLKDTLIKYPFKVFQLFLGSSRSYKRRVISEEDARETIKYLENNDLSLYSHLPYIINLAGKGDIPTKGFEAVQNELVELNKIESSGVLHIGSGEMRDVINRLNDLDIPHRGTVRNSYPLLLENCAGEGKKLGKDWNEIRLLFEGLDNTGIGLCFDTQHGFASGVSDFSRPEIVQKFFDDADDAVGNKLQLIHLNDSAVSFKARKDQHAVLRHGEIWKNNFEGLKEFVTIVADTDLDVIMETSNGILSTMALLEAQKD